MKKSEKDKYKKSNFLFNETFEDSSTADSYATANESLEAYYSMTSDDEGNFDKIEPENHKNELINNEQTFNEIELEGSQACNIADIGDDSELPNKNNSSDDSGSSVEVIHEKLKNASFGFFSKSSNDVTNSVMTDQNYESDSSIEIIMDTTVDGKKKFVPISLSSNNQTTEIKSEKIMSEPGSYKFNFENVVFGENNNTDDYSLPNVENFEAPAVVNTPTAIEPPAVVETPTIIETPVTINSSEILQSTHLNDDPVDADQSVSVEDNEAEIEPKIKEKANISSEDVSLNETSDKEIKIGKADLLASNNTPPLSNDEKDVYLSTENNSDVDLNGNNTLNSCTKPDTVTTTEVASSDSAKIKDMDCPIPYNSEISNIDVCSFKTKEIEIVDENRNENELTEEETDLINVQETKADFEQVVELNDFEEVIDDEKKCDNEEFVELLDGHEDKNINTEVDNAEYENVESEEKIHNEDVLQAADELDLADVNVIENVGEDQIITNVDSKVVFLNEESAFGSNFIEEENYDDLEETIAERLWGLTEMFPESFVNSVSSVSSNAVSLVKNSFTLIRSCLWVVSTASIICALPIAISVELERAEETKLAHQRQMLANSGAMAQPGSLQPSPIAGNSGDNI